ncbi:serine/threonine-protein kinase [Streptomyces sp. NPDC002082]|uniref:serine/threonine-protein kinase n=1 Tax=Streptomyces sp. NPDC002082 TaxID=3154772 RepID=UPI003320AB81
MGLHQTDPLVVGGYRLQDRLGAGGMGTVFLARSIESGRMVAVKVVHQQFADDREFRIRFRQEVASARRVSGAFTAPVVDADPDAERPWMATQFVPGPTLGATVRAEGPLGGPALRQLAVGLAEALRDIHRVGVVHRDLKPDNVLLTEDGPRVIDFGISRAVDHETLTVTGRILGTPPYMSPEQLSAPHRVKQASDVFSLGAVLVYATTGHGPFDAPSHYMTAYNVVHEPAAVAELSGTVRELVQWCLAKDPVDRPTPDELLEAFRAAPEGDWGARPPSPAAEPARAPARGGRLLSRRGALVAGVVGLAGAGALGSWARGAWTAGGPSGSSGGSRGGPTGAGPRPAHEGSAGLQPAGWAVWEQKLSPQDLGVTTCHAAGPVLLCTSSPGTGRIAAFDAGNGKRLWGNDFPTSIELLGLSAAGDVAYCLEADEADPGQGGHVAALNTATGARMWSTPPGTADPIAGGVYAGEAIVTFAAKGSLNAWHPATGEQKWQEDGVRGVGSRLFIAYGHLFRVSGLDTPGAHVLWEHSLQKGGAVWSQDFGASVPLAVGKSSVLLRRADGTICHSVFRALATPTTLPAAMEYVEAGGTYYGMAPDGTVTAADGITGEPRWTAESWYLKEWTRSGRSPLRVSAGRVHVPGTDGSVHCFAADSGDLLWQSAARQDDSASARREWPGIAIHGGLVHLLTGDTVVALRPRI